MCACNVVAFVTCTCVLGTFARKFKILLVDHENVCHVGVLLWSCEFDIVADWRVNKYNFFMTTLINEKRCV